MACLVCNFSPVLSSEWTLFNTSNPEWPATCYPYSTTNFADIELCYRKPVHCFVNVFPRN